MSLARDEALSSIYARDNLIIHDTVLVNGVVQNRCDNGIMTKILVDTGMCMHVCYVSSRLASCRKETSVVYIAIEKNYTLSSHITIQISNLSRAPFVLQAGEKKGLVH